MDDARSITGSNTLWALFALVFQNTTLAILLKLTFRQNAEPYTTSSVVMVTELVKFAFCSSIAAYQSKQNFVRSLIIRSDQWLIFVPSVLYVIQNNLLFLGAKMLPTVVYVVCTQTKILTTALMSRIVLGTRLNRVECASLFFLAAGICLVQLRESDLGTVALGHNLVSETLGLAAVLAASLTSAAAGVTLEKIYKSTSQAHSGRGTVEHTIWTRNVQLSLISLPFALIGALWQQSDLLVTRAFTQGFDAYVWGVVMCQAGGGVIIAYVMKFANNILKCFAVAISICFCAVYSIAVGDLKVSTPLVFGILTVVTSVYVFTTKLKTKPDISLWWTYFWDTLCKITGVTANETRGTNAGREEVPPARLEIQTRE